MGSSSSCTSSKKVRMVYNKDNLVTIYVEDSKTGCGMEKSLTAQRAFEIMESVLRLYNNTTGFVLVRIDGSEPIQLAPNELLSTYSEVPGVRFFVKLITPIPQLDELQDRLWDERQIRREDKLNNCPFADPNRTDRDEMFHPN